MSLPLDELATYPLCAGLAEAELRAVAGRLRRVAFLPGSVVMSQEQPGTEAYLVASGTLQVLVDQPDGESVILAVLGPRALVGEVGVVQAAARSASVVTVEKALLLSLYRDDFHACLRDIPRLARNLNTILAQRLRLASAQIVTMATREPAARVARTLRSFAQEHGRPQPGGAVLIPYRLTQTDLGRLTNLARATVNRVCSDLAQTGVLGIDSRQRVTIHLPEALERYGP